MVRASWIHAAESVAADGVWAGEPRALTLEAIDTDDDGFVRVDNGCARPNVGAVEFDAVPIDFPTAAYLRRRNAVFDTADGRAKVIQSSRGTRAGAAENNWRGPYAEVDSAPKTMAILAKLLMEYMINFQYGIGRRLTSGANAVED